MKQLVKIENKKIGSVMLPRKWSRELLDMLDKNHFGNSEFVFFEPCCGTGNIVIEIVSRQLKEFMRKIKTEDMAPRNKKLFATTVVIRTISNLYAIDINEEYVNLTRQRVLKQIAFFLRENVKLGFMHIKAIDFYMDLFQKAVFYHIDQNEMFSCIEEDYDIAKQQAQLTRLSRDYFLRNGHKPIDFQESYFKKNFRLI